MLLGDPLPEDPYKVLGLSKACTVNDVKKAYRKLALTCHPDKTGALPEEAKKEKEAQFHRVQQAHDLLTSPEERERYDSLVRLQELRRGADLGGAAPPPLFKAASYAHSKPAARAAPPATPSSPIFDTSRPIYETRVPKGVYDEDVHAAPSARYESMRGGSRKHEERYGDGPPSASRRASGRMPDRTPDRVPDDVRWAERHEADDDFYQRKSREKELKAEQRAAFHDRKKARTRTRRHDSESKRPPPVASDSEDSERERFMSGGSPRIVPEFRRRAEDFARASTWSEERSARARSPSSDSATEARERLAKDYILRSAKEAAAQNPLRASWEAREPLDKRAGLASKGRSKTMPTPAPAPPPPQPVETARRSSGRRTGSGSLGSKVRKGFLDIVEPSRDFQQDAPVDLPRRPKKDDSPASASAPSSPRSVNKGSRAATFPEERTADKIPPMRRSQTTPSNNAAASSSASTARPARPSNLKYSQPAPAAATAEPDSGYSSPGSPDETPRFTSRKYRVQHAGSSGSDAEAPRGPRIVDIDPPSVSNGTKAARAAPSTTRREGSPRALASLRAHVRSSPPRRADTLDSASFKEAKARHQHSSSAEGGGGGGGLGGGSGGASGGSKLLFMEMPDVAYSPRIATKDIRFSDVRRGSADGALGGTTSSSSAARASVDRDYRDRDRNTSDREPGATREHKHRGERRDARERTRGDKDRDRDKERDRDRERERDRERDRDRDNDKDGYFFAGRSHTRRDRPGLNRGASTTSVHG